MDPNRSPTTPPRAIINNANADGSPSSADDGDTTTPQPASTSSSGYRSSSLETSDSSTSIVKSPLRAEKRKITTTESIDYENPQPGTSAQFNEIDKNSPTSCSKIPRRNLELDEDFNKHSVQRVNKRYHNILQTFYKGCSAFLDFIPDIEYRLTCNESRTQICPHFKPLAKLVLKPKGIPISVIIRNPNIPDLTPIKYPTIENIRFESPFLITNPPQIPEEPDVIIISSESDSPNSESGQISEGSAPEYRNLSVMQRKHPSLRNVLTSPIGYCGFNPLTIGTIRYNIIVQICRLVRNEGENDLVRREIRDFFQEIQARGSFPSREEFEILARFAEVEPILPSRLLALEGPQPSTSRQNTEPQNENESQAIFDIKEILESVLMDVFELVRESSSSENLDQNLVVDLTSDATGRSLSESHPVLVEKLSSESSIASSKAPLMVQVTQGSKKKDQVPKIAEDDPNKTLKSILSIPPQLIPPIIEIPFITPCNQIQFPNPQQKPIVKIASSSQEEGEISPSKQRKLSETPSPTLSQYPTVNPPITPSLFKVALDSSSEEKSKISPSKQRKLCETPSPTLNQYPTLNPPSTPSSLRVFDSSSHEEGQISPSKQRKVSKSLSPTLSQNSALNPPSTPSCSKVALDSSAEEKSEISPSKQRKLSGTPSPTLSQYRTPNPPNTPLSLRVSLDFSSEEESEISPSKQRKLSQTPSPTLSQYSTLKPPITPPCSQIALDSISQETSKISPSKQRNLFENPSPAPNEYPVLKKYLSSPTKLASKIENEFPTPSCSYETETLPDDDMESLLTISKAIITPSAIVLVESIPEVEDTYIMTNLASSFGSNFTSNAPSDELLSSRKQVRTKEQDEEEKDTSNESEVEEKKPKPDFVLETPSSSIPGSATDTSIDYYFSTSKSETTSSEIEEGEILQEIEEVVEDVVEEGELVTVSPGIPEVEPVNIIPELPAGEDTSSDVPELENTYRLPGRNVLTMEHINDAERRSVLVVPPPPNGRNSPPNPSITPPPTGNIGGPESSNPDNPRNRNNPGNSGNNPGSSNSGNRNNPGNPGISANNPGHVNPGNHSNSNSNPHVDGEHPELLRHLLEQDRPTNPLVIDLTSDSSSDANP